MRKELGKFFIDVAKLILAGVVIAAIMRDLKNTLLVIILGIITVLFSLASGLYLINEKEASK